MAVIGTDPYTVIQSIGGQASTPTTSLSLSLPTWVEASGRLLRASIAIDKLSGGFITPTGWTLIPGTFQDYGAGVSFASYYRISSANEIPTIDFSWTTANLARGILWETNLDASALQGTPTTTAVNAASVSQTASALTEPAYVEAVVATDTLTNKWTTTGPNYSDSFVPVVYNIGTSPADSSAGGVGIAVAARTYATGETPTVTASTVSGSDEHLLTLITWSNPGSPSLPDVPTLMRSWIGGVTTTGFAVNVEVEHTASVRIRVGGTTSNPSTVDPYNYAILRIDGLSPNVTHSYEILAEDDSVIGTGSVKTAPTTTETASFSFAFSSCIDNNSNAPVLATIAERNPAFYIHTGDFGYPDLLRTDQNNLSFYLDNYRSVTGQSNMRGLLSTIPTDYIPDDHDGTDGGNSNGTGEGRANMHTAYRQRVPHYDLPANNGALYHTFTYGRVRFVVWDCRSDRTPNDAVDDASKTMLGAAQKQWFKDLIAEETLPLVAVVTSVVWNQDWAADGDAWGGFNTERQELIAAMDAATPDFLFLSGDAHMLAADDGTNSQGGYANISAAPIDRPASTKGGPWSQGTYESTSQFGWVDITDNGTSIDMSFSGISSDGVTRITLDETYTATIPSPSPEPPTSTGYGEFLMIGGQLQQISETQYVSENAVTLTQESYDGLIEPDPTITYYITG